MTLKTSVRRAVGLNLLGFAFLLSSRLLQSMHVSIVSQCAAFSVFTLTAGAILCLSGAALIGWSVLFDKRIVASSA
jgi:hypothetical protein